MSLFRSLYIPVFSATLLLSAFLLFLVQPMFGKMILPLLGGTPNMWNTAMLFFQTLLLAGYAYAHMSARFIPLRLQAALHLGLMAFFLLVLPIAIPEGTVPPATSDPTIWQLSVMAMVIGGPFFVLSASAPLLQHWFTHTKHEDADNPYFLYAASNLGSMAALLAYPVFVEPNFAIDDQSTLWSLGYKVLLGLVLAAGLVAWLHGAKKENAVKPAEDEAITWLRRGLWLVLAFVPSSLMLGVTTFIATDVASLPLLWVVPLALYVGTFIIAFSRTPAIGYDKSFYMQGMMLIFLLSFIGITGSAPKMFLMILHMGLFFLTALLCHHELAATKPKASHLTQFYLIMSLGGALGGFFNAIVAPNLFTSPIEYGIVLIVACFMRGSHEPEKGMAARWTKYGPMITGFKKDFMFESGLIVPVIAAGISLFLYVSSDTSALTWVSVCVLLTLFTICLERRWIFGLSAMAILALHPPGSTWNKIQTEDLLYKGRNFFGVVRVIEDGAINAETGKSTKMHFIIHGTTLHGSQPVAEEDKLMKLSYYYEDSGISDIFELISGFEGGQRIGTLGLGAGTVACYQKDGRHFDFFEIDPAIVKIAENPAYFSYLSDCGSPYEIFLGDARLKIVERPDHYYDMIIMDAFSSDSIPIHLLTVEAFKTYLDKLTDNGVIIVNIANRYLDLTPVVSKAASRLDMNSYRKIVPGGVIRGMPYHASDFIVMVKEDSPYNEWLSDPHNRWMKTEPERGFRLWTDQYSNILSILKALRMPPALPDSPTEK